MQNGVRRGSAAAHPILCRTFHSSVPSFFRVILPRPHAVISIEGRHEEQSDEVAAAPKDPEVRSPLCPPPSLRDTPSYGGGRGVRILASREQVRADSHRGRGAGVSIFLHPPLYLRGEGGVRGGEKERDSLRRARRGVGMTKKRGVRLSSSFALTLRVFGKTTKNSRPSALRSGGSRIVIRKRQWE